MHTWDVERVVLFFQERVTVESDNLFGNTVRTQEVSDGLCDKNDDLERCLTLWEQAVNG